MAARHHYRRICLDDSSDVSMVSVQGGANASASGPTKSEGKNRGATADGGDTFEMSIADVSRVLEDMSIVEESFEESGGGDRARIGKNDRRGDVRDDSVVSVDENSYMEDSFVVKDSQVSESFDCSFACSEASERGPIPPRSMRLRSDKKKYLQSTPLNENRGIGRKADFRNVAAGGLADENRRLLLELYPELADGSVNSSSKSLSPASPQSISLSGAVKNERKGVDDELEEEEDSFEKYLRRLKRVESPAHDHFGLFKDCDDFVVSDESEAEEGDSDEEEEEEDVESEFDEESEWTDSEVDEVSITAATQQPSHGKPAPRSPTPSPEEREELRTKIFREFRKTPRPKELSTKEQKENQTCLLEESFLVALSTSECSHAQASVYVKAKFAKVREELTQKLFTIFEKFCFENKFHSSLSVKWNARLTKTAGRCHCKRDQTAYIELSTKVCNTPDRVRDTLLHEMCHAAVWVIDKIPNGRHGPAWKLWALRCMKIFSRLPPIERCHNYRIDAKFMYICGGCGQTIKRHSKSLDVSRKVCGVCHGRFTLFNAKGEPVGEGGGRTNKFATFVKSNYGLVKRAGVTHAAAMKELSKRFRQQNATASSDIAESDRHANAT